MAEGLCICLHLLLDEASQESVRKLIIICSVSHCMGLKLGQSLLGHSFIFIPAQLLARQFLGGWFCV